MPQARLFSSSSLDENDMRQSLKKTEENTNFPRLEGPLSYASKHFFLRKGKQTRKGFMDQTWSWRRAILTGTLVWLSIRLVMLCVWFRWRSRAMEFLNTSLQMSQATPCPFIFFIIRWWFMWVTKTLLLEKTSLHLSQVSRFPITPVELRTRCKRHRAGHYLNSIL